MTYYDGPVELFGIPEHATSFALKDSSAFDNEPYRLYNLDVFEYEMDTPMTLYGSVLFLLSKSVKKQYSGFYLNNPTETFVRISTQGNERKARWISEAGNLDVFVFPSPNKERIWKAYHTLTGFPALPPLFSLAYHQCRWNYRDEADVSEVHAKFEELDFPVDVIWLDIEHTDGKRYFTWDAHKFPTPVKMIENLKATGRRMVTIVDPHVKRVEGYKVHAEAEAGGFYVKEGDANFDGWCW